LEGYRLCSVSSSDVLLWNALHFSFALSGRSPVQPLGRQDMR